MPASVELSPRARRELNAAIEWIADDSPAAARRFWQAANAAAALLGKHPHAGQVRPELVPAPVRFLPIRGFLYLMVYSPEPSPPLILRILHAARDLPATLSE